jgi:hypothetical protein
MNSQTNISRRELLRSMLGASAALPFVAADHPIFAHLKDGSLHEAISALESANWTPLFLSREQNDSLISIAEAIVPGSRTATVNRFIDLLLSVDAKRHQDEFTLALSSLNSTAIKQFGKPFAELPANDQTFLLTAASTGKSGRSEDTADHSRQSLTLRDHFENIKGWVSGAYYSSEQGMKELGWTPDRAFNRFPPCEHGDGHV